MSLDSVISSYTTSSTSDSTDSSTSSYATSLDSDAFLNLLLTEIEYQNPLDPMDSTEFVAQLAEFSELEQLTVVAEGMESIVDTVDEMGVTLSLNYLGLDVVAEGDSVSLEDGSASTVSFTLEEDAEDVYANIYDEDGNIVDTTYVGALEAGDYEYVWDGEDYDGNTMEDGTYTFSLYAVDADGNEVDSTTTVAGTVTGMEETDSGVVLTLDDGRTVYMTDVTTVETS